MEIKERRSNDVIILDISGDIDITTSPEVRKSFDKLIKDKTQKVVLNLGKVAYIDSSGLATLVEGLQRLKGYGGKLKLVELTGKVRSLFEITKLEKLFEIFEEEEKAVASFA